MRIASLACLILTVSFGFACGDDSSSSSGGTGAGNEGGGATGAGGAGGAGAAGGAGGGSTALCTDPAMVPCEDDVILQMNLQTDITPGLVENTPEGTGFHTTIDATAGGAFTSDPDSYTYAKFTDNGLEKVSISDQDSLTSMDWDIAFRRYVARINSGNSGPSCVAAARVPGMVTYDDVTTAPDNLAFRTDDYFTQSCELIADGTGLEGSPATALSSYWTYPGCVQMTGNVYVVRLASGRQLKLTVTHFYNETAQQQCQDTGAVAMGNTGSGNIQLRWSFL